MAIINQWPMSETKVLGGGGPGMYSIVLPRSVYWASASEWVQVNSQQPESYNAMTRQQAFCNGNLWVLGYGTISAVDLATGETVDTISSTTLQGATSAGSVCTDGTRYIWIGQSQQISTTVWYPQLIQVDVVEKTVGIVPGIGFSLSGLGPQSKYMSVGPMVYSKKYNSLFAFGAGSNLGHLTGASFRFDLSSNNATGLANCPGTCIFGYGWSDETTGDIYIGSGYGNYLYQYSPESNTFTTIRTDLSFPRSTVDRAWTAIGNTMYCITNEGIVPFDPASGWTAEGPTPQNPPQAVYTGYGVSSENTLYLSTPNGLYKCVLYENIPEEAPIVAKIYKGQKYHTLQPFTIHGEGGDINVTTTQQTAAADIPIKMYTYDNAGGQILIIENGGE